MQPATTHTHTHIHIYIQNICTNIHLCLPIGFVHTLTHTHTASYAPYSSSCKNIAHTPCMTAPANKKCTKQKCAEKERAQQVMANVQQQGHTIYVYVYIIVCACVCVCVKYIICMCSLAISGAFALKLDELIMYVTYKRLCVCVREQQLQQLQ